MTVRRVVGFDPGLHLTGYGVIESGGRTRLVEAGVFRISRNQTLAERLNKLHESAAELLDEHKPGAVAVEELFSHYDRPKTAILMGHARGALLLSAAQRSIPTFHYLPTRVKKFMTGNGHASKEQMKQAVTMHFDLKQQIELADVADALAVALCHAQADRLRMAE